MKFKYTAILIAGLLVCANTNQASSVKYAIVLSFQTNTFTGKWKLNYEQSKLGMMPIDFAFYVIEINQTKDSVTIKRSSQQLLRSGENSIVQTSALNGTPSYLRFEKAKKTKSSYVILNKEGNQIIETATVRYDSIPLGAYQTGYVETFKLSPDGKSLIVIREMKTNEVNANWTSTCVYNKEK